MIISKANVAIKDRDSRFNTMISKYKNKIKQTGLINKLRALQYYVSPSEAKNIQNERVKHAKRFTDSEE